MIPVCNEDRSKCSYCICAGEHVQIVVLTEAAIAGGLTRTTSVALLKDSWIQASEQLGTGIVHDGMSEHKELLKDQTVSSVRNMLGGRTILATEASLKSCLRTTDRILKKIIGEDETGIIVVTGSLHIVSSVLACLVG